MMSRPVQEASIMETSLKIQAAKPLDGNAATVSAPLFPVVRCLMTFARDAS
jgi:hypothetical protein